jgi:predicted permease
MRNFWRDIRYAVWQLGRAPGFTVTAMLTLALGIGATTGIFSVVYALLLKSLPFEDADRIVTIAETHPQIAGAVEATYPDYLDWRKQQRSFSQIAAYSTLNPDTVSLSTAGHAEQVHRVLASGNFFSLLGVSPSIGRLINEHDDHVAVLSATAWQRYFAGDPGVVGRTVDLNGASYVVIGVLPAGQAFPAEGDVWLPVSLMDPQTQASRVWHSVNAIGRLRPGFTLASARTDMETIAARLAVSYPATNRSVGVRLAPLRDHFVAALRPALLSLFGAVVLVLLIACANVANLLLVRAAADRRDVAVRQALGADRSRLYSQFLAQTLVLCLTGGVAGALLALWTLPLLRLGLGHSAGLDPFMIQSIRLNVPVLVFAFGICAVTAVLFGLLPVFRSSSKLTEALRPGDRSNTGGGGRGRGVLVAGEVAIAVVVLFLSALVARSFQKLLAVDPGFRTDHMLSAEITLPEPRFSDGSPATNHFYEQVVGKVAQSPGVLAAGVTTVVPLRPSHVQTRFLIDGAPAQAPGSFPVAQIRVVSPGFFSTMGLGLRAGRIFEQKDIESNSEYFVVNAAFADRYLAGRNPPGANIIIGVLSAHPDKVPVIGVVANARDLGVDSDPEPEIYLPGYGLHGVILVRSAADPEGMAATVRNAVHAVDAGQPVYNVQTLDAVLSDSLARQRVTASLLGMFALVALVLAAVGIYGVLSYSVAQRTREIGVRMAVGADRRDILLLVLAQAGGLVLIGVVTGLAVAQAGARVVGSLLFHTSAVDLISVLITLAALILIAGMAVSVPAVRAASVNPAVALRAE